jgi:hypothetical protein
VFRDTDECVVVHPPTGNDETWFGFCENLGLWRIKAPPFDAYGATDVEGGIDSFYVALAEAVATLRSERPDLAEHLQVLLDRRQDR